MEDGRVRFRGPQRACPPEGEGIMRLTKPEKKALLDLLEWATAYHMEEIEQWIDPREGPFILDQRTRSHNAQNTHNTPQCGSVIK